MTFAKFVKEFKETQAKEHAIYLEGKASYYELECEYSSEINPYKDCPSARAAYNWEFGFKQSYYEQNKGKLNETVVEPDTTCNFRNEGESTRVDRYAGRGL